MEDEDGGDTVEAVASWKLPMEKDADPLSGCHLALSVPVVVLLLLLPP